MTSRNISACGRCLLLMLLATPIFSMAQSPQLAWDRMQQQLKKNDGVIAYEIASNFELLGDSAPEVGQYSTRVHHLDQNGTPLRELVSDGKGSAHASFLLQYATDGSGLVLPSVFQLRYSISMFFKTGNVTFLQKLSDWKPRPVK